MEEQEAKRAKEQDSDADELTDTQASDTPKCELSTAGKGKGPSARDDAHPYA